jgi:hypothetical protein
MAGVILAAAASTVGARAADQSAFFERAREVTDGYYPQYVVTDPATSAEPTDASTDTVINTVAVPHSSSTESPQYQRFEDQLGLGTAGDYTPSNGADGSR